MGSFSDVGEGGCFLSSVVTVPPSKDGLDKRPIKIWEGGNIKNLMLINYASLQILRVCIGFPIFPSPFPPSRKMCEGGPLGVHFIWTQIFIRVYLLVSLFSHLVPLYFTPYSYGFPPLQLRIIVGPSWDDGGRGKGKGKGKGKGNGKGNGKGKGDYSWSLMRRWCDLQLNIHKNVHIL